MRVSKLFLFGTILISIIVLTSFANAKWFNFGEPDLSPQPVTATLTVNTPPSIVKILQVPPGFGVPIEPVQPIAGAGVAQFYKLFVVEDLDNIVDIPTNPTVLNDFVGGIQPPASFTGTISTFPPFTQCVSVPCSTLPGACPNPSNNVIWLCSGTDFLSWYPPSIGLANAANLWSIGLQVKDATTGLFGPMLVSGANPQLSTVPDSYLQVNTVSGFSATGSPTWQSLPASSTNQISSQNIILTSQGNVALPIVSITGTPLVGNAGGAISESGFKMGTGTSVCTTGTTLTTSNVPIIGAAVPYSGTGLGVDILTLSVGVACGSPLSTFQSGPSSTTYTNNLNPWIINAQ